MINPMKEQSETRKRLHATALDAPKSSGVYLWKDESGQVIYVGKAKNLKNRLSSYFTSNRDLKTRILVSRAHTIEYITTDNEYEALLLENTLIKQYGPRYNINLKDGKTYPLIKITNEEFPRVFRTRRLRITSYNVCYTKLLRNRLFWQQQRPYLQCFHFFETS